MKLVTSKWGLQNQAGRARTGYVGAIL